MQRGVDTIGDLLDGPSESHDREHSHR